MQNEKWKAVLRKCDKAKKLAGVNNKRIVGGIQQLELWR